MNTIHLYTNPMSRGNGVLWLLEECGAPYKATIIPFGEAMKTDEYTRINPMNKVPALQHGDTVLTETVAILTYLAEQFPQCKLIPPAGTPERARYYQLMMFATHCEYACLDQYMHIPTSPKRNKSIGYGSFEQAMAVLKSLVQGKTYVLGEQFSAMDVYISSLIAWAMRILHVIPTDDATLLAYLTPHTERPAFARMMGWVAEHSAS